MNKRYLLLLYLIIALNIVLSKSFRVNQIPNGSIYGCSNCHISQFGGGARTDFGNDILSNYLDNTGNVVWGGQLAQIDSDGDGFTNGFELGDPSGNWVIGNDNPGDPQYVTNPGDISSLDIEYAANVESTFKLYQNHPNPFNPRTTISFELPNESNISILIYDLFGNEVKSLLSDYKSNGQYQITWDGRDNLGQKVSSGTYFYQLKTDNLLQTKKMILLR